MVCLDVWMHACMYVRHVSYNKDVIENCGVEAFQVQGESGLERKGCDWIKRWALGGGGGGGPGPGRGAAGGRVDHNVENAKGWDSEYVARSCTCTFTFTHPRARVQPQKYTLSTTHNSILYSSLET